MNFEARLKQLRKEKDITQEQLAKVLNYGRTAIAGYETGRNEPSIQDLNKLSSYFNVSVDYLLGKSEVRESLVKENREEYLPDDVKMIGRNINELTLEQRKAVSNIVNQFKEMNKK